MNNEFNEVGLYKHNAESYKKIRESFDSGEKIVGIVHATGTGKSYNALQLAYDNKDKKTIYLAPSTGIIEHIKEVINENPNLSLDRDFSHVEFRTYQSLIPLSREEIQDLEVDLLILDEFHHIGAHVWGNRVNTIIETHDNMRVFGMTAYVVRDGRTRNMVDPDGDELFSNKIVSRYDLCDAMIDSVLPRPIYRSIYTNLIGLERQLEEKVLSMHASSEEKEKYFKILREVKKRIIEAPSLADVIKKNVKPMGKYIYFCPSEAIDSSDIETIQKEAMEWFKQYIPEENIVFYTSTSKMGSKGKKNRNAFYKDITLDGESASDKLRVMFAINQYNEGIHVPDIDGIIMGRSTQSDIVFFEQLGRALSVRGETKKQFEEYQKMSMEQLIHICQERDITIFDTSSKEDIIYKLLSPVIIDLANNFDFIKELANQFKERKLEHDKKENIGRERTTDFTDVLFDIDMFNQDLFDMLKYVMDRLTMTWEDMYALAKTYYEHHGNLNIPYKYKTVNGYEEDKDGVLLGAWIRNQRVAYKGQSNFRINGERIQLLEDIGMVWDVIDNDWNTMYTLAKTYYEHYEDLNIPRNYKTVNGYEEDKDGVLLGVWIQNQRQAYKGKKGYKINGERIELLENIGMVWNVLDNDWNTMYTLAKTYYEHYGNLNMPSVYKTVNGYEEDKNGVSLGRWICTQRNAYKGKGRYKISEERIELLENIEMQWYSEKLDCKSQQEMIVGGNTDRKQIEILNRFRSLLNKLQISESDVFTDKKDIDEINDRFIYQLNRKK